MVKTGEIWVKMAMWMHSGVVRFQGLRCES